MRNVVRRFFRVDGAVRDLIYSANSQVLTAALATARALKVDGLTYVGSDSCAVRNIIRTFVNVLGFTEYIRVVPLTNNKQ